MTFLLLTCGHMPRSRSWITTVLYVGQFQVSLYIDHTSLTIASSFWLFLVNEVYLFHISFRIAVLQWKYQRVECVDTDMEPLSDICWPRSTYHSVTGTELTRCSCWVHCYCLTFVYGTNYTRVVRDQLSVSVITVLIQISKQLMEDL